MFLLSNLPPPPPKKKINSKNSNYLSHALYAISQKMFDASDNKNLAVQPFTSSLYQELFELRYVSDFTLLIFPLTTSFKYLLVYYVPQPCDN